VEALAARPLARLAEIENRICAAMKREAKQDRGR
jgi:hypothetical protein